MLESFSKTLVSLDSCQKYPCMSVISPGFLQFAKLILYLKLISHIYIEEMLMPDKVTSPDLLCRKEIGYIGGEVREL